MEQAVKGRFALQDALHSGLSTQSAFPGMPTDYIPQRGDLLISDMVPYYNGYWGDSCSSYVVGGENAVTETHRAMHKIALEAFEIGFQASRPGVTAGEIDALVRGHIAKQGYQYPHHTGHGVGVSNQDEPRIIIDGPTRLEAGMVMVIEPPVYQEGFGGLRLERMYLIKDAGAELIAHNPFDLA
jgi:Xaa-Pro dipeptidase